MTKTLEPEFLLEEVTIQLGKDGECAFIGAGIGMRCEVCTKYVHPGDDYSKELLNYYNFLKNPISSDFFKLGFRSDKEWIQDNLEHDFIYKVIFSEMRLTFVLNGEIRLEGPVFVNNSVNIEKSYRQPNSTIFDLAKKAQEIGEKFGTNEKF